MKSIVVKVLLICLIFSSGIVGAQFYSGPLPGQIDASKQGYGAYIGHSASPQEFLRQAERDAERARQQMLEVMRLCELVEQHNQRTAQARSQTSSGYAESNVKEFLMDAKLFSADGKFLGVITSDRYNSDSIFNQYKHGSKHNDRSIWNTYSSYGDNYSEMSPFSKHAGKPPRIVKNRRVIAYLSINTQKKFFPYDAMDVQVIHPSLLLYFLNDDEGEEYRARIMEFME